MTNPREARDKGGDLANHLARAHIAAIAPQPLKPPAGFCSCTETAAKATTATTHTGRQRRRNSRGSNGPSQVATLPGLPVPFPARTSHALPTDRVSANLALTAFYPTTLLCLQSPRLQRERPRPNPRARPVAKVPRPRRTVSDKRRGRELGKLPVLPVHICLLARPLPESLVHVSLALTLARRLTTTTSIPTRKEPCFRAVLPHLAPLLSVLASRARADSNKTTFMMTLTMTTAIATRHTGQQSTITTSATQSLVFCASWALLRQPSTQMTATTESTKPKR